jgi:hypothetical protein
MLTFSISLAPLASDIPDNNSNRLAPDLAAAVNGSDSIQSDSIQSDSIQSDSIQEPTAKLGWILIQKRWISAAQLQVALLHQAHQPPHCAQKLGEFLVEQSMLSEVQLKDALQEQYWRRHSYWVI